MLLVALAIWSRLVVGWLITHPLRGVMSHESSVNRWFVDQRTPGLTDLADIGTFVGQTLTGAVVLVVLGVGFAVWKRTWWPLVFVGVLDAGLGLFYLAGTTLDPRQRPPVHILQSGLVADHSFPSGHTGTAGGSPSRWPHCSGPTPVCPRRCSSCWWPSRSGRCSRACTSAPITSATW